jgi:acetyl-CoA carboxylase biotin carboxyl carrier protein
MDTQHIEDMITILEGSGASELEVRSGESVVRIIKSQQSKGKKLSPKKAGRTDNSKVTPEPVHSTDLFITAPMVGIFHTGSAAIKVDQKVTVGQVVGMIESMKIHNELVSRVAGYVSESMVEDGTPVEYGQPLFRVAPEIE